MDKIGINWRIATQEETAAARTEEGAPHVMFGCECCGMTGWHAKNLALSSGGYYNGARRIFPPFSHAECDCPPSAIKHIVPMR